jgi:hypothetical protein
LPDLLSALFGINQPDVRNEGNEAKRVGAFLVQVAPVALDTELISFTLSKAASSRTRASLVTFQGDSVSIRAKQATISLRKGLFLCPGFPGW